MNKFQHEIHNPGTCLNMKVVPGLDERKAVQAQETQLFSAPATGIMSSFLPVLLTKCLGNWHLIEEPGGGPTF